jgi:hypothetical protein
MVRHKMIIRWTCCCLAFLLSSFVMAAPPATESSERTRKDLDEIRMMSTLLGSEVRNKANEKIAGLTDLVMASDGSIHYAVLSHGGVAGVGATHFAVPWELFEVRHANGKWAVYLDSSKEALAKAPTFKDSAYKDLMNIEWVTRVHDFFYPRTGRETHTKVPAALPMVLRASKIDDAKLMNTQDQNLGKVVDLLLDRHYRAAYAIVGHGGVLGIGESYIPIPWSKLRMSYNRENTDITAVIDATKAQLEKAPLVKEKTYATMVSPGFAGQVDRYFGVDTSKP